jgi:hypothetical protein
VFSLSLSEKKSLSTFSAALILYDIKHDIKIMAEREGKEDDRGGTAEVSIWMRKVWFLKKTKKRRRGRILLLFFALVVRLFSLQPKISPRM